MSSSVKSKSEVPVTRNSWEQVIVLLTATDRRLHLLTSHPKKHLVIRVIVYLFCLEVAKACVCTRTHMLVSFASLCWHGGLNLAGGFEQNS